MYRSVAQTNMHLLEYVQHVIFESVIIPAAVNDPSGCGNYALYRVMIQCPDKQLLAKTLNTEAI